MMFMNQYEIEDAENRYLHHPVLGPASRTLFNLMVWTNQNSDGWAYWPKPCRAAAKLQDLLYNAGRSYWAGGEVEVSEADVKAALKPIKAFRTRQNADFEIVEV